MSQEIWTRLIPWCQRPSRKWCQQSLNLIRDREWNQHAHDEIWCHSIRHCGATDVYKAFNAIHWNLCRQSMQHVPIHKSDHSRFKFKVLPLTGRGAMADPVKGKVYFPNRSGKFLLLIICCIWSIFLLYILHLSSDLVVASVTHDGIIYPLSLLFCSFQPL